MYTFYLFLKFSSMAVAAESVSEEFLLSQEGSIGSGVESAESRIFEDLDSIVEILPQLRDGSYPEAKSRDMLKQLGIEWISGLSSSCLRPLFLFPFLIEYYLLYKILLLYGMTFCGDPLLCIFPGPRIVIGIPLSFSNFDR
jgi:hypothetical protein